MVVQINATILLFIISLSFSGLSLFLTLTLLDQRNKEDKKKTKKVFDK